MLIPTPGSEPKSDRSLSASDLWDRKPGHRISV